jgi:hypothetical protein
MVIKLRRERRVERHERRASNDELFEILFARREQLLIAALTRRRVDHASEIRMNSDVEKLAAKVRPTWSQGRHVARHLVIIS